MTSNSKTPCVTIAMTIRNEEKLIGRALNSLLSQTFSDFELIISDSASTDKTGEICKEFEKKDKRIKYCRHETNITSNADLVQLVKIARGKYFMIPAGDDLWEPDFISTLVNELENHPEAGLAMCAWHHKEEDGTHLDSFSFKPEDKNNPNNMTYLEMVIQAATNVGINKIPYVNFLLGLFRTDFLKLAMSIPIPELPAPDRLLLCQISLATKIRFVNKFLFIKTIHPEPLAVRQSHNEYIKIHNTDKLSYTSTWLAMEPYLWASKAIPDHRKCMIPLVSEVFMKTNWGVLYRTREHLTSFQEYNCDKTISEIGEEFYALEYLIKNKLFEKAHQLASSLALKYSDNPDLLTILAEIKSYLGPKKSAKKILMEIISDCPKHSNALKNLAVILWDEGKLKDAIHLAKDAVDADEDNIEANLNLAKMLVETGVLEEGSGYLEKVLRLSPQNIDALKLLGSVCVHQGHKQRAYELLKQAEKIAPDDEEVKKLILMAGG